VLANFTGERMSNILDAVVRITTTIDGSAWQSSGVMISPDEVLTANHVSEMKGTYNSTATGILVDPGYNMGLGSLGSYTGTVAHDFDMLNSPSIAPENLHSDYSIIHLDKPVVGVNPMKVTVGFDSGPAHITGYPSTANGAQIDQIQNLVSDPNLQIYDGSNLVEGSSGSPVWTIGLDGSDDVFGVVSAGDSNISFDAKFTATEVAQLAAWVAQDDYVAPPPAPPTLDHAHDTTGAFFSIAGTAYTGPVAGLHNQFIMLTPDNLHGTAVTPRTFIRAPAGTRST